MISTPTVVDHPEMSRYELVLDADVVGHLTYQVTGMIGRVYTLPHTQVDAAHGGQGYGGVLVQGALDDIRRHGGQVVPQCPFVDSWMTKHPEYEDLRA